MCTLLSALRVWWSFFDIFTFQEKEFVRFSIYKIFSSLLNFFLFTSQNRCGPGSQLFLFASASHWRLPNSIRPLHQCDQKQEVTIKEKKMKIVKTENYRDWGTLNSIRPLHQCNQKQEVTIKEKNWKL